MSRVRRPEDVMAAAASAFWGAAAVSAVPYRADARDRVSHHSSTKDRELADALFAI